MPRLSLLAAIAAALALTAAPAHGAIGSSGLGDPYFPKAGNGGYDVTHYKLDLRYSPRRNLLRGAARISATSTIELDRFNLDLRRPLRVRSLRVNGTDAEFDRAGQELVITPATRIEAAAGFTVDVSYRGKPKAVKDPDGTTEGWIRTDDGAFAPNEPQGSPSWFPCNDHPSDKAAYEIEINVPRKVKAISNGTLEAVERRKRRKIWRWREPEPMATYLATVAIGDFEITRSERGPAPSLFAVDPDVPRLIEGDIRLSARPLRRTPATARYLARKLGPYPFSSLGAIVDRVPDFPYALESQTRPLYTEYPSRGLVVHEIAHQWFGNSVTLASWPEIWLNEGFATYAEWLYEEDHGGASARQTFDSLYSTPARYTQLWDPPPGNPGGAKHLFATSIYQRGAMTLQALRDRVGDATFFAILRTWLAEHAYGNVTTPQFVELAERLSGQELDRLFEVWLFKPGKPRDW